MEDDMQHGKTQKKGPYGRVLAMTALAFLTMYVLMYAMVNTFSDVFNNFNQVYMAGLMAAPMVIIELALMWHMYPNRTLNIAMIGVSAAAAMIFFLLIRQQAAISDRQFLKSMIPHHSSAILMCEKAPLGDTEILELCKKIVSSQQAEIDQMNVILKRMN